VPHASESLIDILHDLRGRLGPAELEKLLPNVTSISVDDSLWDATKKLVDHDSLVVFWDGVKCLLNDMAAECVHG